MFSSLISPIAGSVKDGGELKTDREELLVELVALNFHETFELKPLMEDVDTKLAKESKSQGKLDESERREALRSIARRIADRQIGSIQWEWASTPESSSDPACQVYTVTIKKEEDNQKNDQGTNPCVATVRLKDDVSMNSPDKAYTLHLVATKFHWEDQTIDVETSVYPKGKVTEPPLTYTFNLSWFDLPFTDNTLLPDGNRFAINLNAVDKPEQRDRTMRLRVLWFPKGFFTPRERPLNFQQVRKLIGVEEQ